jgi:hypothetical protein
MVTTVSRTLASSTSITYIRASTVNVTLTDARPNTKMYVFFDDVLVNEFCQPVVNNITGALNADIITDAGGTATFIFNITANKWLSGSKNLVVADVSNRALLDIPGNVYGSASTAYDTKGTLEIYNNTRTIETVVQVPYTGDPLAESFFTYGVTGGCFVTSIDLYFQSKDPVLPVRVELRKMVNGYPDSKTDWNSDAYASVESVDVLLSNDSSVATNFKFKVPIYLEQDKDYCFIVMANSNAYNLWTSKLGERAIENNKMIFSQPYVGSMFKSQNNSTWTAEQTEDIKFTLNKAVFDTAVSSDLTFIGSSAPKSVSGKLFTTTNGSATILYTSAYQHGLDIGSKFRLAVDTDGIYNGISGTSLNGDWNVSRVIDDYSLEFIVGGNATSSGKMESSGIIRSVVVANGGINYTSATTVTVSAPPSGTTATVNPVIIDGKISRVDIVDKGTGYTSTPSLLISGAGTGAELVTSVEPLFTIVTNKKVNRISPQIDLKTYQDTAVYTSAKTTTEGYGVGNVIEMDLSRIKVLEQTALVASRANESSLMNNANSFEMNVILDSSNPNVSPMIDLRNGAALMMYSNAINAHSTDESMTATIASSGVSTVVLTSGGSGYSGTPIVTVTAAENETSLSYVLPTMTTTIASGIVTAINIITPGSGLTRPPIVSIAAPMSGTGATAYATLLPLNSELNTAGNASSRYITKLVRLKTASSSIKLSCYLFTSPETDVNWYIRTSLSADNTNHAENSWKLLKCDVSRDKNDTYQFYLDKMSPFDVYDLKMVPSSTVQSKIPYVKNYSAITVA